MTKFHANVEEDDTDKQIFYIQNWILFNTIIKKQKGILDCIDLQGVHVLEFGASLH